GYREAGAATAGCPPGRPDRRARPAAAQPQRLGRGGTRGGQGDDPRRHRRTRHPARRDRPGRDRGVPARGGRSAGGAAGGVIGEQPQPDRTRRVPQCATRGIDSLYTDLGTDPGLPARTEGTQVVKRAIRLTLATFSVGTALLFGTPGAASGAVAAPVAAP